MTDGNGISRAVEYVCGGCKKPYVGLSTFSVHATRHHDYENVSEAVEDCHEIRGATEQ